MKKQHVVKLYGGEVVEIKKCYDIMVGWYTHSDNEDNIPPTDGWTFNGGRCSPSTLGINIRIQPL